MPEETTPPEGGNSVETTPPVIDWDSADNPYVQRYRDTQAEYTRNQQRLRELERYESDPNAYFELGKKHGVEFEFPEQQLPQQGDETLAQYQARLEAAESQLAEFASREQEREFEQGRQAVIDQHNRWAEEAGLELDDFDHAAILQRAFDTGAETLDDVKGIFDAYVERAKGREEQLAERLAEQRRRPRVPHTPGGSGATETGVPDWSQMSPAEIDKYMAERATGSA